MDRKSLFSVRFYSRPVSKLARAVSGSLYSRSASNITLKIAQSSLLRFLWVTLPCDSLSPDRYCNCPTRGWPTAKTSQTRISLADGYVTQSRGSPWLNYFPLYLPLDASLGALKFSDQRESLKKEHRVHIVKLTTKMPLIKTSNEGTLLKTLMLHKAVRKQHKNGITQ